MCVVPELTTPDDVYRYINTKQLTCDKPVMVGGQLGTHPPYMVGEKWVCMSPRYNIVPGSCVILSFGIDQDFSFDDDLDKRFNCKVFAFDPTIALDTHQRSPNIKFFHLGIGATDGHLPMTRVPLKPPQVAGAAANKGNRTNTIISVVKVPVARYSTILKMLDLHNATIDYLKIDVEGAELDFFSDVFKNTPNLLKNVKQIGMEVHMLHDSGMRLIREKLWAYFHHLECYGFKLMFSEINPVKDLRFDFREHERSCCYELVWARDRQW